jgi:hypothetical protein
MIQRLVWNFEFNSNTNLHPLLSLVDQKDEQLKWEIRCFWLDNEVVTLNPIDPLLLDLANYQRKHKEDYYYLLPGKNYNIKRRLNEILYKPLITNANDAAAYAAKITLSPTQSYPEQTKLAHPELEEIMLLIEKKNVGVHVKKEALISKLPTTPTIKIELARIEILNKIYFSACVEGKSLYLVETIAKHLLGEYVSCEYVAFLKNIIKL